MKADERKAVWIHNVQTRLSLRLSAYWLLSQLALWNLVFIWRLLQEGPGDPLEQYRRLVVDFAPALVATLLLLPILVWDTVKFSHRIFGPIYRFRCVLQALAAGEPVPPVRLRQDDFLTEVRDDLNHLLETLQRQGLPVLKPLTGDGEESQRQPA